MGQEVVPVYDVEDAAYVNVNIEDVEARVAGGDVRGFEYSTIANADLILALLPRQQLMDMVASAVQDPSALTSAQLAMEVLRAGGYVATDRVEVTSYDDDTWSTAGGDPVTITGTGFTSGRPGTTAVTFDGEAATSVVIVSNTSITCVTPPHAAGAAAVAITNDNGSHTGPEGTYA